MAGGRRRRGSPACPGDSGRSTRSADSSRCPSCSTTASGVITSTPAMLRRVSPFAMPSAAYRPLGRTAYTLTPSGLPSLTAGTSRTPEPAIFRTVVAEIDEASSNDVSVSFVIPAMVAWCSASVATCGALAAGAVDLACRCCSARAASACQSASVQVLSSASLSRSAGCSTHAVTGVPASTWVTVIARPSRRTASARASGRPEPASMPKNSWGRVVPGATPGIG